MSAADILAIIDELRNPDNDRAVPYFHHLLNPKISLATGIWTKKEGVMFPNINGSTECTTVWYPTSYPGGIECFIDDYEVNLYNADHFIPSYTSNINAGFEIFRALGEGFHYNISYKYVITEKDHVVFIAKSASEAPYEHREWRGDADTVEVAFLIAVLKAWLSVKYNEVYEGFSSNGKY